VAGAITIYDDQKALPTAQPTYLPYTRKTLLQAIENATVDPNKLEVTEPLGNTPTLEGHSLGGYQGKLLVAIDNNGKFYKPLNGAPSTHIIKPLSLNINHRDLTESEVFAQQLATACGLAYTQTQLITKNGVSFMLQSRYDRIVDDKNQVFRLHQEDGCAATG